MAEHVGYVGLGSLGARMVRRVAGAGYPVVLYARRQSTLEGLEDLEAEVAATVPDLAAQCDVVVVAVPDDDGVVGVMDQGLIEALRPGSMVLIHTTGSPDLVRRLDLQAAAKGSVVVDAPVSTARGRRYPGEVDPPIASVMVGATDESFERCRPILEAWADPVLHMGPVGSGQQVKVINNLLYAAHMVVARDAVSLAAKVGLDPGAAARAVNASSGASWAMVNFERGLSPDADPREVRQERLIAELAMQLPLFEELVAGDVETGGRLLDLARVTPSIQAADGTIPV
jgi:3-hydroxyisobutyrate dehydrogenase